MLIRYLFKLSNHGVRQNMLVLISVSWLPLLFISMIEGSLLSNVDIPFLKDVVPYVRCLVVIPLLILIEAVIAPMLANVIDYLASSKIVIEQELDELARYKDSMYKQMDSVWSNAILLLLALFVSSITRMDYQQMLELQQQSSWAFYLQSGALQTSYAGLWYIYISLPLVSFIMYRWFWRFIVWCFFLYRVSCLKLQLQATHSDLCGGIGIIGVAQNLFGVVFLAMSMKS